MTTNVPNNRDDIIDSRDVIEAVEDLQDGDETMTEELAALKTLAEQCEGYGDWDYGETLIRDSYFQDYAQELAHDLGYMEHLDWPHSCIDWEQAARELQYDYTCVDFDGVTYWLRSC